MKFLDNSSNERDDDCTDFWEPITLSFSSIYYMTIKDPNTFQCVRCCRRLTKTEMKLTRDDVCSYALRFLFLTPGQVQEGRVGRTRRRIAERKGTVAKSFSLSIRKSKPNELQRLR